MSTKMISWTDGITVFVVKEEDEMRLLEIYQDWFEREQFIREEVDDFFLQISTQTQVYVDW